MPKTPWLNTFVETHRLTEAFATSAPKWFNPVAEWLISHQQSENKPLFVGINGCQGSGKSTMSDYLATYLSNERNLQVAVLSLDDFYLSQAKRAKLADEVHPLLSTRGVPGTHDTQLIKHIIDCLKQDQPVQLPRFNKATDNPFAESQWPKIDKPVDIVLFEGWCWGVTAQNTDELAAPINALELNQDNGGQWRRFINQQLRSEYVDLYASMDCWLMLKAPDFSCVSNWRKEQEAKLRLSNPDASGVMSEAEIDVFIQHFQRLTQHALAVLPKKCDLVVRLDQQRNILDVEGLAS